MKYLKCSRELIADRVVKIKQEKKCNKQIINKASKDSQAKEETQK